MGAHIARNGGISLKIVESKNRITVRRRCFKAFFSPLLLVANTVSVAPKPSGGACSEDATHVRRAAPYRG
jgi:hypothetical protein